MPVNIFMLLDDFCHLSVIGWSLDFQQEITVKI